MSRYTHSQYDWLSRRDFQLPSQSVHQKTHSGSANLQEKTWDPWVKTAVVCVHRGVLVSHTLSIMSWYLTWDPLPFVASNPLSCHLYTMSFVASNPLSCHLYTMRKSERLIKPSCKNTEQGLLLGSTWPNRCAKSTCPLYKINMPVVQNPHAQCAKSWKPLRYGSWKPILFLAKFRQKEKLKIRNSKMRWFSRVSVARSEENIY